ncbi:MAG: DUF1343 domain-containing protein [Candidatus Wallbacteria bacterium]
MAKNSPIIINSTIKTGLDFFIQSADKYSGVYRNIGLISNSRAIDKSGECNFIALKKAGFNIKAIFTPEHGYFANIRDGEYIKNDIHPEYETPIYSLFTEGHLENAVTKNANGLDLLIFDIQDCGVRFYTYIHALGLAIEGAEKSGLPIFVLDRPNPVGCTILEGPSGEDDYISELCPYKIPVRYGLTIGELARLIAKKYYPAANLKVFPVVNYDPAKTFSETRLIWPKPSPAMVSPETSLFYPGTCFFEGTNLSEGRGTDAPFRTIGAPFVNGAEVCEKINELLNDERFSGISVSAVSFKPLSSKYEGIECGGILLDSSNYKIHSFAFGISLVKIFHDLYKDKFTFLFSEKSRKFFFDRLAGTAVIRKLIMDGTVSDILDMYKLWEISHSDFNSNSKSFFLYHRE